MKAREAFEHFDFEQLGENRLIISEFASALGQIKRAYARIRDQTVVAQSYVSKIVEDISPRLRFHLSHTLQYIQRMIEVNFVRGWTITDERTLNRVTSKFYETISSYDKTIAQFLAMSQQDEPKRQVGTASIFMDPSENVQNPIVLPLPLLFLSSP